jgi:hypothetical protein
MTTTTARRAFLVGTPLAFAALLLLHPTGGGDFYALISENVTRWLALHYAAAALFPLMGYALWLLIRDLPGRAAKVARIAIPVYAVSYSIYETAMGIVSGIMSKEGNGLTGAERDGVAAAVNAIPTNPIVGEPGVFASIGGLAWAIAIAGAIVALRQVGVGRGTQVLLGFGAIMVLHIPPFGPIALVCFSAAALLIETRQGARSRGAIQYARPSSP